MDVVYGPYWWEGPDFKKQHTYGDASRMSNVTKADGTQQTIPGFKGALGTENEYSKNFFAFAHDFNADGWTDILILGFPGEASWWFENPQGKDGAWAQHVALDVTDNESPNFLDLTGDGKPEIVCSSGGYYGYAEPDPANPNPTVSRRCPFAVGHAPDSRRRRVAGAYPVFDMRTTCASS
jgi:hypothetical protein